MPERNAADPDIAHLRWRRRWYVTAMAYACLLVGVGLLGALQWSASRHRDDGRTEARSALAAAIPRTALTGPLRVRLCAVVGASTPAADALEPGSAAEANALLACLPPLAPRDVQLETAEAQAELLRSASLDAVASFALQRARVAQHEPQAAAPDVQVAFHLRRAQEEALEAQREAERARQAALSAWGGDGDISDREARLVAMALRSSATRLHAAEGHARSAHGRAHALIAGGAARRPLPSWVAAMFDPDSPFRFLHALLFGIATVVLLLPILALCLWIASKYALQPETKDIADRLSSMGAIGKAASVAAVATPLIALPLILTVPAIVQLAEGDPGYRERPGPVTGPAEITPVDGTAPLISDSAAARLAELYRAERALDRESATRSMANLAEAVLGASARQDSSRRQAVASVTRELGALKELARADSVGHVRRDSLAQGRADSVVRRIARLDTGLVALERSSVAIARNSAISWLPFCQALYRSSVPLTQRWSGLDRREARAVLDTVRAHARAHDSTAMTPAHSAAPTYDWIFDSVLCRPHGSTVASGAR